MAPTISGSVIFQLSSFSPAPDSSTSAGFTSDPA
jgi:hypothetical protein